VKGLWEGREHDHLEQDSSADSIRASIDCTRADGDGIPDTGALNTGQATDIVIRVSVPAGVIVGDVETTVVEFTSSTDVNISKTATVISEVPPPGVDIGPSAYISADPGEHLNVTIEVKNTGAMPDTMDIATSASLSWTVALMHDDGVTPLTDTDGDGAVDSGLMDGLASMQIVVLIDVDPDAPLGTVAHFELTVTAVDAFGNVVEVDEFTWSSDIGSVTPTANSCTADCDAGDEEGTGTVTVSGGGKSLTVPVMVSGGAATFGEQIAQPSSIALLVAVIVLAALCVLLFLKNQQLARQVKQGGGPEEPKGPETQQP